MISTLKTLAAARGIFIGGVSLLATASAFCQVSPSEIRNPRAKAAEQEYLPRLESLRQEIGTAQFPYSFRVARYLNAHPGQGAALDSNGIEFVYFHNRVVLKISGLYMAAFDAAQLSQNERVSRTFKDAVGPILRMVSEQIPRDVDCDAIGIEIVFDTRDGDKIYDFEGKEALTIVISRDDAFSYAHATTNAERQEIIDRSDIYVNGKPFGLALEKRDPIDVETLDRSTPQEAAEARPAPRANNARMVNVSGAVASGHAVSGDALLRAEAAFRSVPVSDSSATSGETLRVEAPSQVHSDLLLKEDEARFHLEQGASPSFEIKDDHTLLHLTMRNTMSFERNTSSIYKRAAQSFDLFLAPELRDLLGKLPADGKYDSLEFSVLNRVGGDGGGAETIDYICPLDSMRSFVENKITSQDFINQSKVLVNGVRIGVDLQMVE